MNRQPIEPVQIYLDAMISQSCCNPYLLDCAWLSIITFDAEIRVLVELIEILRLELPTAIVSKSGATHFGRAPKVICAQVDKQARRIRSERKGEFWPALFAATNGRPSDLEKFRELNPEVRRRWCERILVRASAPAAPESGLEGRADADLHLEKMHSATFGVSVYDGFKVVS